MYNYTCILKVHSPDIHHTHPSTKTTLVYWGIYTLIQCYIIVHIVQAERIYEASLLVGVGGENDLRNVVTWSALKRVHRGCVEWDPAHNICLQLWIWICDGEGRMR